MKTIHGHRAFTSARQCRALRHRLGSALVMRASVAVAPLATSSKKPIFPFVKIQGQEEMKLALLLNVVDPNIGGVLIMGDRGTGKSVAVRGVISTNVHPKCKTVSGTQTLPACCLVRSVHRHP